MNKLQLTGLISIVFVCSMATMQDAEARECSMPEELLDKPKQHIAYVIVTVTDIDSAAYLDEAGTHDYYYYTYHYTIDELIYGNSDFPKKQGNIVLYKEEYDIGQKLVTQYYDYGTQYSPSELEEYGTNGTVWEGIDTCDGVYTLDFIPYMEFYLDLKENPCSADKKYIVKYSDLSKRCVSTPTHDVLVDRGYGFDLSKMHYLEWKDKLDPSTVTYERKLVECYTRQNVDGTEDEICVYESQMRCLIEKDAHGNEEEVCEPRTRLHCDTEKNALGNEEEVCEPEPSPEPLSAFD